MPAVQEGSKEPFIIYRDRDIGWNVAQTQGENDEKTFWEIEVHDPLSKKYTGKDFSNASYPIVYDTILADRVREEWDSGMYSGLLKSNRNQVKAIVDFFEDYVSAFSQNVMDYLAKQEKPLTALAEMCPINIQSYYDKDFSYNTNLIREAINKIEDWCTDRLKITADLIRQDKRFIGDYEVKHSICLDGKEIVFAENVNKNGSYMVCNVISNDPLGTEELTGVQYSDYLYAMREFAKRVESSVEIISNDQLKARLPLNKLTKAECLPDKINTIQKNKLIIIKADALAPEHRHMEHQLVLCIGGLDSKQVDNMMVSVKELRSGKEIHYKRDDIEGLADLSKIPKWAVDRLMENQNNKNLSLSTKKINSQPDKKTTKDQKKTSLAKKLENAKDKAKTAAESKVEYNTTMKRNDKDVR
jgi:hypothetical protein